MADEGSVRMWMIRKIRVLGDQTDIFQTKEAGVTRGYPFGVTG